MFVGTGTMKHVGITDSDRERLKMSVKTLASWSAHALSTRPGNLSSLVNVDLFKGLAHICYGERDHSRSEQLMLSCSVACLEASIGVILLIWKACVTGQLAALLPL